MSKQAYYVVWEGHRTGVFSTWEECKAATEGYRGGAKYKKFDTLANAQDAFKLPWQAYIGKNAPYAFYASVFAPDKPQVGLVVDAACSGNPGLMEYRGVCLQSGEVIFHQKGFEQSTNNIGEFLAIVHALSYLHRLGDTRPVYSDSYTAISWVRKKQCATKLEPTPANAKSFQLIARAQQWLKEHRYANPLEKWETNAWGEIPADFGRKHY